MKLIDLRTDCERWLDAQRRQRQRDWLRYYGVTIEQVRARRHEKLNPTDPVYKAIEAIGNE
jgi:hypothetical protein